MACGVALKRPYDYEAYISPDDGSDAKRRCTNTGCSPFRPYLGTLAASLPNASNLSTPSKFASGVASHVQLSPGQLQSYLKAEVQLVCERLLKQQEIRIRFEYESKLNKLLEEQHDQFVQFTREQEKQHSSSNAEELSYYS
ncbi:unnamed protein product [Enterobius vermicularis]|uniref:Akirin n=1 Tax=Enterobius vermicularis TaxID=51028 RepID=A0A0N4VE86_ENTVE|nr:unnamed protein product [Enterobius vermicularis]